MFDAGATMSAATKYPYLVYKIALLQTAMNLSEGKEAKSKGVSKSFISYLHLPGMR
jgi:hypothetical protein